MLIADIVRRNAAFFADDDAVVDVERRPLVVVGARTTGRAAWRTSSDALGLGGG